MPAARSGRPSHRDIVQVVLRHHLQVAIPRSYGPSGHLVYRPLRQLALHPPIDDSNKTLTSSASLMSIDASQSYCRPSECLLATRRRSDFRSSCLVLGVHRTCTHPTDPDRTARTMLGRTPQTCTTYAGNCLDRFAIAFIPPATLFGYHQLADTGIFGYPGPAGM
jgi:hypothetical protein